MGNTQLEIFDYHVPNVVEHSEERRAGTLPPPVGFEENFGRELALRNGGVTLVDADDYDWLNKFKWQMLTTPQGRHYVQRSVKVAGKVHSQFLHRLIMDAPKGMVVDHVNNDGLDNRRSNLRVTTQSRNLMKQTPRKTSTSQYRGVSLYKYTGRWTAKARVDGREYPLGYFGTEEEAARAYDRLVYDLTHDLAFLNFPNEAISLENS